MKQEIQARLRSIETEEHVRIVYACESGSRAWGFPSTDSDYDVRFIYLHPRDWYLSIDLERKRDVIERLTDGVFDVCGWDLRKALAKSTFTRYVHSWPSSGSNKAWVLCPQSFRHWMTGLWIPPN